MLTSKCQKDGRVNWMCSGKSIDTGAKDFEYRTAPELDNLNPVGNRTYAGFEEAILLCRTSGGN